MSRWVPPKELCARFDGRLKLELEGQTYRLNDWSFNQVHRPAGVTKGTVDRLSSDTKARALEETSPREGRPLQVLARDDGIRTVHGASCCNTGLPRQRSIR